MSIQPVGPTLGNAPSETEHEVTDVGAMITWKLSSSSIAELMESVVPVFVGTETSVFLMRLVDGAVQSWMPPELC